MANMKGTNKGSNNSNGKGNGINSIRRGMDSIVIPSSTILKCTVCDAALIKSYQGVKSHLLSHVRRGKLNRDNLTSTAEDIMCQSKFHTRKLP